MKPKPALRRSLRNGRRSLTMAGQTRDEGPETMQTNPTTMARRFYRDGDTEHPRYTKPASRRVDRRTVRASLRGTR